MVYHFFPEMYMLILQLLDIIKHNYLVMLMVFKQVSF